jgi:UDP-N-acetylglucosamine 2-epimerase (non-hydrolysing)
MGNAKKMKKVLLIFGTRPEAIKLAPVIKMFSIDILNFKTVVVVTSQHREMLDQALQLFEIRPDHDLNSMKYDQTLAEVTTKALEGLEPIVIQEQPDLVFVQGDTTSTFVGSLAAFYHRIPVAHVEAGLRTYNRYSPYPEEINRVMTSHLADLHFAPTELSKLNLLKENIPPSRIFVTGNTVIDALLDVASREYSFRGKLQKIFENKKTKKILLTTHRRENHGNPMEAICGAILEILNKFKDVEVVCPVHMSPKVRNVIFPLLGSNPRIHLVPPLDYQAFVNVMKESYIILTDSGGVQEEAPSLGKPVLVLRETTERPEAVQAGTVRLVGTDFDRIVHETGCLLNDSIAYETMAKAINPYGDGSASVRILQAVKSYFSLT